MDRIKLCLLFLTLVMTVLLLCGMIWGDRRQEVQEIEVFQTLPFTDLEPAMIIEP